MATSKFKLIYNKEITFGDVLKLNNLARGNLSRLQKLEGFSNRIKCKFRGTEVIYEVDFDTLYLYRPGEKQPAATITDYNNTFIFLRSTLNIDKFYNVEKEN